VAGFTVQTRVKSRKARSADPANFCQAIQDIHDFIFGLSAVANNSPQVPYSTAALHINPMLPTAPAP
jgi:hypothetical protein